MIRFQRRHEQKRSPFRSSSSSSRAREREREKERERQEEISRSTRTNVCCFVSKFVVSKREKEEVFWAPVFFFDFSFFLLFFCSPWFALIFLLSSLSHCLTVFVKTSSIMREPLTKTKTKKKEALRRATSEKDDGKQTDFFVKERIETATMEVLGKRGLEKTC